MNKLVYLHELDSVRTSKEQILIGQKALFEEIVHNGNQVVLSFNQLTDSRAFLIALEYDQAYEQISTLLKKGAIKVARYYTSVEDETGKKQVLVRTAAEYMIRALSKQHKVDDNKFICSALPILNKNWTLREIVKEAICYSDPGRIQDLVKEKEADDIDEDLLRQHGIIDTSLEDLKFIAKYVKMILAVSQKQVMYAKAKPSIDPENNTDKKTFMDYMEALGVGPSFASNDETEQEKYSSVVGLLNAIYKSVPKGKENTRSFWLEIWEQIYNRRISDNCSEDEKMIFCYAEMAINLCYNYTVEDGILEVSKHYRKHDDFLQDFQKRIRQLIADYHKGIYRLFQSGVHKETVEESELPNWSVAERAAEVFWAEIPAEHSGKPYEESYKREKLKWGFQWSWRMLLNTIKNGWYIIHFVIATWLALLFESCVTNQLFSKEEIGTMREIVVTAILFGVISTISERTLHKYYPKLVIPDVTDSIKNLFYEVHDILYTIFNSHKNHSYVDQERIR